MDRLPMQTRRPQRGSSRIAAALLLVAAAAALLAQPGYEVVSLEGSAKVQRAQKKSWENIGEGTLIGDNDIIETFFKTKLVIRFGDRSNAILGSNSKALFNIAELQDSAGKTAEEISFTLFGGGIFVKAVTPSMISIYTSNGVCDFSLGSVSAIVDPQTGETGFQVLGGNVRTRNISQQKGRDLIAGQTTMIIPGREPTAPLYLTFRHVAILKHFFGDKYVEQELEQAGITPTEDVRSNDKLLMSQNLFLGLTAKRDVEQDLYRKLFSINTIYGKILEDRERKPVFFTPAGAAGPLYGNMLDIGVSGGAALAGGNGFPLLRLSPSVTWRFLSGGLRLDIEKNANGAFGMHSAGGGLPGYLDLVDHLTAGDRPDSLFISAGAITDLTIGGGLVVNHFDNRDRASVYQPLGLFGQALLWDVACATGFIGDASDFSYGGIQLMARPATYQFTAGYYFDRGTAVATIPVDGRRFLAVPDSAGGADDAALHVAEATFTVDLFNSPSMMAQLSLEYAHKLMNGRDGFLLHLPTVACDWLGMRLGGSLTLESGRAIGGAFDWRYPAARGMLFDDNSSLRPIPPAGQLSRDRSTMGIRLFCNASPLRGLDLRADLRHDLIGNTPLASHDGDSTFVRRSYDFYLYAGINEELVPKVKTARIYLMQSHGGYYPESGSYFDSWGTCAGASVLTVPLFFNLALEAGVEYYLLDIDGRFNNTIDDDDRVFEFHAGVRWGVL